MSDHFDHFADGDFEQAEEDLAWALRYQRLEEGLWEQRDGSLIHISKMGNRHIRNTINMLNRQITGYGMDEGEDEWREDWIHAFHREFDRRSTATPAKG